MTIIEAAPCGTPAVATRITGHSDAVIPGHTGLLVHDPADPTRALSAVLINPALRHRLAQSARAHAAAFT